MNTFSVCLPHQMPYQLVRKVLGRAKTFQINSIVLLCWRKPKHNSARNAICVQYPETIKTTIYNEWNKRLMKRLRQSIADPLWPAHEKRSGRQNAYKASSLPLWSDVENSPSGAIVTFSLWQSSNSHTATLPRFSSPTPRLQHNTRPAAVLHTALCFKGNLRITLEN